MKLVKKRIINNQYTDYQEFIKVVINAMSLNQYFGNISEAISIKKGSIFLQYATTNKKCFQ